MCRSYTWQRELSQDIQLETRLNLIAFLSKTAKSYLFLLQLQIYKWWKENSANKK